jgi:hypothetical protein
MHRGILSFLWKLALVLLVIFLLAGYISTIPLTLLPEKSTPDLQLLKLSEDFLYEVKTGKQTNAEQKLSTLTTDSLLQGLTNDASKKVFWLNIYNGWFQLLAGRDQWKVPDIFTKKVIRFKDRNFSLDEIEHGILRKYRWKYSLGYLPHFFIPGVIKQLAVRELDYRIHFALNCGAKSCPAIAFYTLDQLNQQLDLATENFMAGETTLDNNRKIITTSKILDWYSGDFGGSKGIKIMLGNLFLQNLTDYKLTFKTYDWTANLGNYVKEF